MERIFARSEECRQIRLDGLSPCVENACVLGAIYMEGKYEYRFVTVGGSLVPPYDQSMCWAILLPEEMPDVETRRSSAIVDFLSDACSLWYMRSPEVNKTAKNKKQWAPPYCFWRN